MGAKFSGSRTRRLMVGAATVIFLVGLTFLVAMAGAIAQSASGQADPDEVLALSGAVLGLTLAAWLASEGDDWIDTFLRRIDKGIRLLETGFRL